MNRKVIISIIIVVVICVGVLAALTLFSETAPRVGVPVPPEMMEVSEDLHVTIENNIASIVGDMDRTAALVSGLSVSEQENVIRSLYDKYPLAVGVSYTNAGGVVSAVVPKFSMSDISHLLREQHISESSFADGFLLVGPLSSKTYGEVICFITPVYTAEGEYNGYITLASLPSLLIDSDSNSIYYKDTPYNVIIADVEGTMVYYPDAEFIGTNVLTSNVYKQAGLINQISPIFEEENGTLIYNFYDVNYGPMTENLAVWSTIIAGGRDLGVLLVYNEISGDHIKLPDHSDMREMISTVESMLVYAKKNGKNKALAEMNSPNGQFVSDDFTIFAYDMEGNTLAYPDVPALVGENRLNYRDSYGIRSIDSMITRCHQGGGYLHTYTPIYDTDVPNAAVIELVYVLPVDDTWFVGAKQPVSNTLYTVDYDRRNQQFRNVQAAQQYIINNGKDAALLEFAKTSSQFASDEATIYAMDYTGVLLADPTMPDMVGSNFLFYTDPHGGSTIREMIVTAKAGGGFRYMEEAVADNPDHYKIDLMYVEPVDDNWYIGSFTTLDTFTEQFRRA